MTISVVLLDDIQIHFENTKIYPLSAVGQQATFEQFVANVPNIGCRFSGVGSEFWTRWQFGVEYALASQQLAT
jgi:hypothetical protein